MILAIVGPTGVGKTKLSIELAKKYHAIIINCDAIQVYKELNIGSAKVTKEEMQGIPHELIDFKEISDFYTVYDYQKDARKLLNKYEDKNIIFVGGTGLYLKAALYDYRFSEDEDNLNNYAEVSTEELYNLALKKDPFMQIHKNNRQRLIRFLNRKNTSNVKPIPLYNFKLIGLTTDRDTLYRKINNRVDEMFKLGLLEEAKNLYDRNINSKVLKTAIGYKELYRYFNNEITLEEAKELIKKNSRHYAKRQYTWFNNQMDVKWFNTDYDNFLNTINEVINYIEG